MTLGKISKPDASQFMGKRSLFLVPNFVFPPDVSPEADNLLESYWSEVRDHIQNLERSLGPVRHVFHEMLYETGEDGMKLLDLLNPKAKSFIQALCESSATLAVTEDRALVEESMDWQRCLSVGLASEKVMKIAFDGMNDAVQKRFENIASVIDQTLEEGEAGVLFIRDDHKVQFPREIQVFFVGPPSLDAIKRWISEQMKAFAGQDNPSS